MEQARNPSASHAAAWKARAFAALHSNSSLSVRRARYNAAMAKARALEPHQQSGMATSDPHTALAWIQSGKPVRITAENLRDHLRHTRALLEALAAFEARQPQLSGLVNRA